MGCEGVGVVTAVGPGAEGFVIGDAVMFSKASFRVSVLLNVKKKQLGHIPEAVQVPSPNPEWTAVPVSALTATSGLEIAGSIKPGSNILVTGAAGGTGHIA